jgi:hypothetical protein
MNFEVREADIALNLRIKRCDRHQRGGSEAVFYKILNRQARCF